MTDTTAVLPDDDMRALGFTDRTPDHWYLCRRVAEGVTFNLTVDKQTGAWEELVMDEDYGQPFYYGNALPAFRDATIQAIDQIQAELVDKGLSVRVEHRAYGVGR